MDPSEARRLRIAEELRFALLYVPICLLPVGLTGVFDGLGLIDGEHELLMELIALSSLLMLVLVYQLYRKNLDVEARQQALKQLARVDALTGLGNRRALFEVMQRELGRVRRLGGPLSVLLVDLDGFKAVNDTCGHAAGDRLLQCFAMLMARHTREHQDALFRVGGDEFVVILTATAATSAREVAERLANAYREAGPRVVPGVETSCSVGVAEMEEGEDVEAWLGRADAAMYAVKAVGGGVRLAARDEDTGERPLIGQRLAGAVS